MSAQTDGPFGSSHVTLRRAESTSWWAGYRAELAKRVKATSLEVVASDADFIVDRCLLAPERVDGIDWDKSRERSGAVMGAVQSGKTASMLAVIAKALDGGIQAVVVLGGTRTALWLQTLQRLRSQLDVQPDRWSRRLMLPSQDPAQGSLDTLYSVTDQLAANALARGKPMVAVVLKQVDHLERMTRMLHEVVYPRVHERGEPFHLLVVDDEADDSSIDENDLTAQATMHERQVPRRIVDLWESRHRPGQTAIPELHATYLAYTATPQANFLQDPDNPLSPRSFVVCLRTPGPDGDPDHRAPTYRVPEGLPGWYTGGDIYYRTLADVPLCIAVDDQSEEDRLVGGIRAFLVASAVRLTRGEASWSAGRGAGQVFGTQREAKEAGGPVMSMLVHPSAAKDEHYETAGRILAWTRGLPASDGPRLMDEGDRRVGVVGIAADMDEQPDRWMSWLAEYARSWQEVDRLAGQPPARTDLTWDELRRLITQEVVPVTTVAVVNSDPRADDRPDFEELDEGHGWRVAPNLSTIFVSGNVMSRGLTLEGLSTTVFTRSTNDPASDTQMQMQRWFGYRGAYIDVCRVLMSSNQISLFRQYHETDLALRHQILSALTKDTPASPSVLQGRAFKATAKIKSVRSLELWPGPEPFMTYLNSPSDDTRNQQVVADLFRESEAGVPDESARQGRLLDRTLSLTETADVLDLLRYPGHDGGARDPVAATAWSAVEGIADLHAGHPYLPLYRMPRDTDPAAWGASGPFDVAAYLRFWALCLEEKLPGVFTTDDPPLLWSLLDLSALVSEQPRFHVGLRFGPRPPVTRGPLADLPWEVRPMRRDLVDGETRLAAKWGSRNYRDGVMWGDEFFDRYRSGQLPPLTATHARARGTDGLLLFHVIERDDGVSLAPALHIPVGGPAQVQARRRTDGG